jgi:hypothetical protein
MASSINSPEHIDTLNFEEVGLRWTVRSEGERFRFIELAALQDALDDGELTADAELTYDGTNWRKLSDIPDLRAYFWQVWKRAQRGEIQTAWMPTIGGDGDLDDLIEEDAPTTIAPPDSELSQAIQEVLARELMARSLEKTLLEPLPPEAAPPEPQPEPRAHAPAPAAQPSDVPGILRAMAVSVVLILLAVLVLLSLP